MWVLRYWTAPPPCACLHDGCPSTAGPPASGARPCCPTGHSPERRSQAQLGARVPHVSAVAIVVEAPARPKSCLRRFDPGIPGKWAPAASAEVVRLARRCLPFVAPTRPDIDVQDDPSGPVGRGDGLEASWGWRGMRVQEPTWSGLTAVEGRWSHARAAASDECSAHRCKARPSKDPKICGVCTSWAPPPSQYAIGNTNPAGPVAHAVRPAARNLGNYHGTWGNCSPCEPSFSMGCGDHNNVFPF